MLITVEQKKSLESLFHVIRVKNIQPGSKGTEKVEQILAYLEVIDSCVGKISKKRELVFIDSAAGNCYLSFLVYHYYKTLCDRQVMIHCIDSNNRLMKNSRDIAEQLGFLNMTFHSGDILDLPMVKHVDIAYSLHACDTATDKALWLGIELDARYILSVACCQHTIRKKFKNNAIKGVTRYKAFKEQLLYLVADTMRAHLVGMCGYKTDIFEFTSTRNTDKNIMIRATKMGCCQNSDSLKSEYAKLRQGFGFEPFLAKLIQKDDM
ncbi:methyltransferase [Sediminispirochaeta smaragdinae]|jgi:hypothetical protein|uniref:Methyltransferase domain-containing protein n=1 Tax=Sediminispirochaeta smaragdinae (strain DSM 11293 / JCM 15392 / SEBR 4228) TaxID=573413 RepID=E1RC19_SEDSS|nr:methyltransferase [Sediminispirochaeta smaragdinae]ADK79899.1 conserved hypothetical protein [Sediminispirochaeta smaragdinae DSM 11293]